MPNPRDHENRPHRSRGRPRRIAADAPEKKPLSQMSPTEKWHDRRNRLYRVLPTRIRFIDEAFHGLVKISARERYEITDSEIKLLVAHLSVWVRSVEESFRAGKEIYPSELPAVTLDQSLTPPLSAIDPQASKIIPW